MSAERPASSIAQIATVCFSFVTALVVALIGFTLSDMSTDMREMRRELREHLKFHMDHPMPDQAHHATSDVFSMVQ